jgi:hypothetical protein
VGGHYHLIEVASIARKCSLYARSARRRKLVYTEAAATDSSRHVASEPLAGTWQGLFNSLDAALASGEVGAAPPDMPVHGAWCTCGGASRCPPSASRSRVAACPVSPPPASPAQWMLTRILLPEPAQTSIPFWSTRIQAICEYADMQTGFSGGRRNSSTESRRPGGCETGCIAESLHVV